MYTVQLETLVSDKRTGHRIRFSWWRAPIVVALLAIAVILAAFESRVRVVEANIAAWIVGHTLTDQTAVIMSQGSPAFVFDINHHWYGIRLTIECSIAFYIAALVALAAVLLLLPRTSVARVLLAAGLGTIGLFVLNQIRLEMLAFALGRMNKEAFNWAHSLFGSVLMLIGVALCLLLFLRMSFRREANPRHRGAEDRLADGADSSHAVRERGHR
jgi:exosortase/archaeosortase family protein